MKTEKISLTYCHVSICTNICSGNWVDKLKKKKNGLFCGHIYLVDCYQWGSCLPCATPSKEAHGFRKD